MATVSFIHTEINPGYSEGSGGGKREHSVSSLNPDHSEGWGGGRRVHSLTELTPIYLVGTGGGIRVFIEQELNPLLDMPLPSVTTGPATNIEHGSAVLHGFLEDDGELLCDCGFEWGISSLYGNSTPSSQHVAGEYFLNEILGILPDTLYHYRSVSRNAFGIAYGSDRMFISSTMSQVDKPYFQRPLIVLLFEDL